MERIERMLADWRGKLAEWDVVNEVYRQHDLLDICGQEILVDWFKLARRLDPAAKLYYNDANTLVNNQPGHQDHYYQTIQWLLEQGAPVDGMGFQCHVHSLIPPEVIYQRIDRFAQLGPEIHITEFNILSPEIPETIRGRYARDFMIAVFSHPKPVGIVAWLARGLRESSWNRSKAGAAFFREDWSVKPVGQAWLDLKTKEWHTYEQGKTDANDHFQTRGFHGKYEVLVKTGKDSKIVQASLGKEDRTIRITLKETP